MSIYTVKCLTSAHTQYLDTPSCRTGHEGCQLTHQRWQGWGPHCWGTAGCGPTWTHQHIGWHHHPFPGWCHMGTQAPNTGQESTACAAAAAPISPLLTLWAGRVPGQPAPRATLASPTILCQRETPWSALHAAREFRKEKCQMLPSPLARQYLPRRWWQSHLLKKKINKYKKEQN